MGAVYPQHSHLPSVDFAPDPRAVPRQLLDAMGKRFPGCWATLAAYRGSRRAELPVWPAWCYLPIAAGYAVATGGAALSQLEANPALAQRGAQYGAQLVGLAAWQANPHTQVWELDAYRALWEKPLVQLPTARLYRLPPWCTWCVTPGVAFLGRALHGVFVWLEWDVGQRRAELRLSPSWGDPPSLDAGLALHLDQPTVAASLEAAWNVGAALPLAAYLQALLPFCSRMLALVVDVCG